MRVNGPLATGKLEAVFKSSDLHPGSTRKDLGGINSQINNANAESGPRWKRELRERVLTGISKRMSQEGDHSTLIRFDTRVSARARVHTHGFTYIFLAEARAELRRRPQP